MTTPVTLEQSVKERIKGIIGELISEETWDKVVRESIHSFLRDDLPKLIKFELTERYKKIICEEMQKPEWTTQWDEGGSQMASQIVTEIIRKNAGDILVSMIGGITQQIVQNIRQQIQQYR